jgi:hypothetical protein
MTCKYKYIDIIGKDQRLKESNGRYEENGTSFGNPRWLEIWGHIDKKKC